MSALDEMQDRYDEFWSRRRAIKERQRAELEAELEPQRNALAASMWKVERDLGYTVAQVAQAVGNSRNFVYLIKGNRPLVETDPAIRAQQGGRAGARIRADRGLSKREPSVPVGVDVSPTADWAYDLDRAERIVWVTRPDGQPQPTTEHRYELDEHGFVSADSFLEWVNDTTLSTEERAFYRGVIQDIEQPAQDARNALDMQALDD